MNLMREMPQTGLREFLKASGIVVMFRLLDVKCAGKLNREDFMEGLKVLGYAGDGSGAEDMFSAIDGDCDGVVTPHDFAAFFRNRL
jgi:Ca2+-binding EF-hand superfamily protein